MHDPDKVRQVLDQLEKSLGQEYPHQDLVRQRDALLEFLGSSKNAFLAIQDLTLPREQRVELFQRIWGWYERYALLFPEEIRDSVSSIVRLGRAFLQEHTLALVNDTPKAAELATGLIDFSWSLLAGYEVLLRRLLVRLEREGAAQLVESQDNLAKLPPFHGKVGEPEADQGSAFRHSPDYRSVNLRGQEFTLTPNQARVVQKLHEAHRNRTPDLGDAYLIEELELQTNRLRDVFKGSGAWGELVVPGEKRGTRRLNI